MAENSKRMLITGTAGFIGFHVALRALQDGWSVLGVDNFSPYYDVSLKEARNDILSQNSNFSVARISLEDNGQLGRAWEEFKPDVVIHLAAQAGVRYSVDFPDVYISSNLVGTYNILELSRRMPVRHLLAASTSSVYGGNKDMPFVETHKIASPLTLYAATKASCELMAHSYAHLFRTPTTFFRFFTVYGPWGRPDMALFKFTKAMLAGEPIDVYNGGKMKRDFTFVDDLVEAVMRLIPMAPDRAVEDDSLSDVAPFRVVNIGQGATIELETYIAALEAALGMSAKKNYLPMQIGDVLATEASPTLLRRLTGFSPSTPVSLGVPAFVQWYREYYKV